MQFYHSNHYLWGTEGFSVMCGGHAQMGGAQTSSVIIDMQYLNTVEVIEPTEDGEYAILKIGGGSKGGHVYDALDGTDWAFLGPRAVTIGEHHYLAMSQIKVLISGRRWWLPSGWWYRLSNWKIRHRR